MFYDSESESKEVFEEAKIIHSKERCITLQSLNIVAKLDEMHAWHFLGITVDQLALGIGPSPSQYYKRLKAAKIMKEFPAALEAFEKGETQISHIAMIGNRITPANASVILEGIKFRSKREVEDLLSRVCSNGPLREHDRIIEKTLRMTESQAALFDRVLEVQTGCGKNPTTLAAMMCAWDFFLEANDPMRLAGKAAERRAKREARLAQREADRDARRSADRNEGGDAECDGERDAECDPERDAECDAECDGERDAECDGERDAECDADQQAACEDIGDENSPVVANEPGEHYTVEELQELTPLERIQKKFKNKLRDPRRPIRAAVRHRVWLRDEGRCTFVHGNGERCKERKSLELDHLVMACRGGTNDESNLALKCRAHNQFSAELELGRKFMEAKRRKKTGEMAT